MLPELLKDKEFNSIIIKFYRKRKASLLDIVLFGSVARGKEKPGDIDILLLFKEKEDIDLAYELRKKLESLNYHVQITTKTYGGLFERNFKARASFLSEGYSFVRKQPISLSLGYANRAMFKYSLKGFSQSRRMQFQYALYGRNKKSGIANELKLNKFADGIFLCPMENSERLKAFMEQWGLKFETYPLLIPEQGYSP